MYNEKSDIELWRAIVNRDKHVFKYIYQTYVQSLFRYSRQYSHDSEAIKDCIQDVFVKLYHRDPAQGQIDNMKLYLFVSLKNALLNLEKRKNMQSTHLDAIRQTLEETTEPNAFEKAEEDRESHNRFDAMISLLTDRQQQIVHCRFVEGMSIPDIAELMEMNTQSVSNLIYRSLAKLKKELKKE